MTDWKGHVSELLGKALNAGALDQAVTAEDKAKLLEAMVACVVPGDEKDMGRAALINGAAYFPQMDGAPFDPAAPNFDTVGVNAVLMAVGLMLRIYLGDAQLIDSLEVCRRFNLRIQEAAVHVQVKGENGVKLTHGHVPDTKWGSEGDCTRDSPDFDEAVVMMAPWTDADGTVTSAPEPVHGAFAAGSSMTMAAMFGDETRFRSRRPARERGPGRRRPEGGSTPRCCWV